jgi:hypothetical protein
MWSQFLLQNFHFSTNIFASLAFFSIFWLYLDAWIERKNFKDSFKITGFLFLSISFLIHSTLTESTGGDYIENISLIFKNLGLLFLIAGLAIDPLIAKPKLLAIGFFNFTTAFFVSPILISIVSWLYLRRATIGLENHTKKVSLAFFVLSVHEILNIFSLFAATQNISIYNIVAPFGPIWIVSHVFLLIGSGILIQWAFSYLLKRINTQLFIIFTTSTLAIFLITTISFTFLLLNNLSEETLTRLNTDVSVLSFALDAKKSEAQSQAAILSQNPTIITAVISKNKNVLTDAAEDLLVSRKLGSVVIIDESGQVLARGEERDRVGDSMSSSSLVKRTLIGESLSSITSQDSILAPKILVQSSSPIFSEGKVIGASIIALPIDNNFLDGIKKQTGLEIGVYGADKLSATTISDLSGITRPIGIKSSNKKINDTVLNLGNNYSGSVSILNTNYFAVFHPIKDINNDVLGMLTAGRPAESIYETASKSIELTFLITIALIAVSVFPSYYIAKYLTSQIT